VAVSIERRRALFLDRDGVINEDCGYCHRIDQWVWVPGIFETIKTANRLNLAVIVVTNQAGIARGYYDEAHFLALSRWMREELARNDAPINAVYYCPYHPEGQPPYDRNSPLRKPGPGMLLQAARDHDIDLSRSLLIGDQESDIQAGRAAGLSGTALLAHDAKPRHSAADIVLTHHAQASAWLESNAPQ
jgi:D-glycero-D-manno-heptose 1,7-bisphosphate phosphatase